MERILSRGAGILIQYMEPALSELKQPLVCRIWDARRACFSFTDAYGPESTGQDRWTGFFDKQGLPLYERDIIRVHYDWRLGWVSALITRHPERAEFAARATDPFGKAFYLGFYYFADSYLLGNHYQHPAKLKRATVQFSDTTVQPWWLSPIVFRRPSYQQRN